MSLLECARGLTKITKYHILTRDAVTQILQRILSLSLSTSCAYTHTHTYRHKVPHIDYTMSGYTQPEILEAAVTLEFTASLYSAAIPISTY